VIPIEEEAVKKELLDTDSEYLALHKEHEESEERLLELSQKSLPSEEDELEEKRLKLHKLFLKDRMAVLLRSHVESGLALQS